MESDQKFVLFDIKTGAVLDTVKLDSDIERILAEIEIKVQDLLPSQWVDKYRILPAGSRFEGKYSFDRSPYILEPLNCLSPDFIPEGGSKPAKIIAIMKALQVGFTEGLVMNGIGWIISESPGNTMLLSAVKELSKEIVEERLDPMILSSGLRDNIRPAVRKSRNQRTGDTSASKEFIGGRLIMDSIQSMKKARQRSVKYGFFDDFEAAPKVDKGAGSALSVWKGRFAAYGDNMKLFLISTPELRETSNIEPAFLLGDQRYFNVHCPKCGEYIDFKWRVTVNDESAGIVYKLDDSDKLIPSSVGYVCQKCAHFFTEKKKKEMMIEDSKWIPTAEADEPGYYSYHLNALYAPSGMYNWEHYVRWWLKCYPVGLPVNRGELHAFRNTALGETWAGETQKPQGGKISKKGRPYHPGKVPDELSEKDGNGKILFLTLAADLNGKEDDARIDYEIVAHCENMSTYSINHGSIGTFGLKNKKGVRVKEEDRDVLSYDLKKANSVWIELREVIKSQYQSETTGKLYNILLSGVDYGHFTGFAKKFVASFQTGVVGVSGFGPDQFTKSYSDKLPWKKSKEIFSQINVDVNTYKDEVAEYMKFNWVSSQEQPPGYMNYPMSDGEKYTYDGYFKHYSAESREAQVNESGDEIAFIYKKRHSRVQNHFWDCRIYNMTIRDVFFTRVCEYYLKEAKVKDVLPSWQLFVEIMKGQS